METMATDNHAADVADRLWRAYAPYQRGRNTSGDLTSMLAILVLARFVEAVGEPNDEFVTRWGRAVAEASIGLSPLADLRAAMRSASSHTRFPVSDLRNLNSGFLSDDDESDDAPWTAAFLTALERPPMPAKAGWPEVCELLLERHVQDSSSSPGEFYTPRTVARLLIELADPQPGDRILDPACGFGGLLTAAAQRIGESGHIDGASFEAYATDRSNPPLATMNLAIHGVDRPVVRSSDPASLFQSRGNSVVDRVVSNPPFNQRIENIDIGDWPFGQPPESNANFAWLQLAWTRLSQTGTAAVIMPPQATWSTGREAEIRRQMINSGAVLGIVALPSNLFARTPISVHIWILAHDKARHLPSGAANTVLFIDASRLGARAPRQSHVLTAEDIERISSRFQAWMQSPRAIPDEPGFSRSVTQEEILGNDANLDPRLYVDIQQERSTTALDLSRLLDELDRHARAMSSSSVDLQTSFSMCERLTRGQTATLYVPVRTIMQGTAEGTFKNTQPGQLFAGPSGSLIRADDYIDAGGIPVVMPRDLTSSGFDMANIRYVTEQQAQRLDRFRLRPGDVVLARRGELGRCAVVREEHQGWVCGTGCFLLRPPAELDADYFAAYLRSPDARMWLDAHSTGSMTMKTISLDVLGELPVKLPDLGTQQAIASAMGRLDEHERQLREQLALTQQIRHDTLGTLLTT